MTANLIPGTCKVCSRPLSRSDMQHWLDLCERTDRDPLDAARMDPPGILCLLCFGRALVEAMEEPCASD